mmetsp:Transcript_17924/g.23181  ORF Transcript_17924/g.23181 Transcript_17924/m.23181 type:complete len:293 (+) Transcript_17924:206-1084(+)|eukprot:CAMPEP_0198147742 /NCGR_PEP_ID=MMETSP1443-20131203/37551_1 /TAXON_ID=186043 /ORGANISM="Entomoneis sp., Strain CCMP2396" /LENGTH=292 /DNA_ID=CAMNT_0043812205 /DNA_START=187 /DNA_END=1065 /DNA_ORIENTATION=-
MGNTQPKNRTGKKVTAQKLENAKKLGVLSLSEHDLDDIPTQLYSEDFRKMRTLDLSSNKLTSLGRLSVLTELKSLNVDKNSLCAGSLSEVSKLNKLQSLSCCNNMLGMVVAAASKQVKSSPHSSSDVSLELSLPPLPVSLKQLMLAGNRLVLFPQPVLSPTLVKLEKIDLSDNSLSEVPEAISALTGIQELRLDRNKISHLPESMGEMKKLKVLSLKQNQFTVKSTLFNNTSNPQPIPQVLFTETPLIDLNLHGNAMTNTQLNQFDGFQTFLERRQKVKSKTMTNLDVCGLE